MTPEEMQAELEKLREENAKLDATNKGLLRDKINWRDKGRSIEERLAELEATREQEAAALKATFEAEKRALKQAHEAQLAQSNAARDAYVIGSDLKGALAAAGVIPALAPAVEALLKARGAKVIEKDGSLAAMIGDKPALEYLKEWAGTDEGKHFVGAANTGGGAPSGAGAAGAGAPAKNPYAKDSFNLTLQGQLERDNPTLAKELRAKAG
jgi:hypothetical protein